LGEVGIGGEIFLDALRQRLPRLLALECVHGTQAPGQAVPGLGDARSGDTSVPRLQSPRKRAVVIGRDLERSCEPNCLLEANADGVICVLSPRRKVLEAKRHLQGNGRQLATACFQPHDSVAQLDGACFIDALPMPPGPVHTADDNANGSIRDVGPSELQGLRATGAPSPGIR
jgi:hypothetical protein